MIEGHDGQRSGRVLRGAFGVAIIAAHVGFIAILARSMLSKPVQVQATPLLVDLVEQPLEHDTPPLAEPKLTTVQPVSIAPPDVPLPPEPPPIAITVVAVAQPATTPAAASAAGVGPPSMSQVAYLKQPAPRYPAESRHAREEGLVILRVLIDESGHAKSIDVYRSSGHPRLDEAARIAIERALFKPYVDRGVARAATAMVPVEFSLHGSST